MKRIYMTLGLVGLASVGVFAQPKTADLSIRLLNPASNSTFDNFSNPPVAASDTLTFMWEITNAGPGDVTVNDTIFLGMGIAILGLSENPNEPITLRGPAEYELPANTTDTLYYRVWQGHDAFGAPVEIPSNAVVSTFAYVFARDGNGELFEDEGIDPVSETVGGNNFVVAENITIGDPSGILTPSTNVALSIYPNPVQNGILNIQYEFKANTQATVNVMDVMGRTLLTESLNANAGAQVHAVNVANLPAGNYLIEITSDDGRAVNKFTIK